MINQTQQQINITDPINDIQNIPNTDNNTIPDPEKKQQKSIQFIDGTQQLTLTYNEDGIFSVSNTTNETIGTFTLINIIDCVDSNKHGSINIINPMIDKYIGKVSNGCFIINSESQLMQNIHFLMLSNQLFKFFEETQLNTYTSDEKSYLKIKKFIYVMIEHTINTISIKSMEIKESNDEQFKENIKNHCIGITYRMTQYLNHTLMLLESKYETLKSTIDNFKITENKFELELKKLSSINKLH